MSRKYEKITRHLKIERDFSDIKNNDGYRYAIYDIELNKN